MFKQFIRIKQAIATLTMLFLFTQAHIILHFHKFPSMFFSLRHQYSTSTTLRMNYTYQHFDNLFLTFQLLLKFFFLFMNSNSIASLLCKVLFMGFQLDVKQATCINSCTCDLQNVVRPLILIPWQTNCVLDHHSKTFMLHV